MSKRLLFITFLMTIISATAVAQVRTDNNEEEEEENTDAIELFNSIETYSKKRKVTKFIHKLIFVTDVKQSKTNKTNINDVNKHNFKYKQDKIIRKIKITTLDPFGFSESDSTKLPTDIKENIGNRLHLKTKKFAIKNLLIFKENQYLDSLKIRESERLIRTQRYVKRVIIEPIILPNNPDSVDVSVRILDSWSLYTSGSLSSSRGRLRLVQRNFGGFGHEFSNQLATSFKENKQAYNSRYQINNIRNTYISTGLLYDKDLEGNFTKNWNTERPLYSVYANWGAGVQLYQRFYRDTIADISGNKKRQDFKYFVQDYWFAYSTPIIKKQEKKADITNFIASLRYFSQRYNDKPSYEYDTLGIYSNQNTMLFSIGLSSINYRQDKYIFNHNIIEDIRIGEVLSITAGLQEYNNKNRYYLGTQLSFGSYTNYGYISSNIEWGSFFFNKKPEQSAFRIEALYFTNIFNIGKWKFRNFIRSQLIVGYNRMEHIGDKLRLDTYEGIEGIKASNLRGTRRGMLSLQLQSYAPTNWLGFRFNPYLNTEFGFLGEKNEKIFSEKIFSKFGIGVVINNDYLVFNNFMLSFAYYPYMPDRESAVIKTNSIRNNNLNLRYFNYDGKPSTIHYR